MKTIKIYAITYLFLLFTSVITNAQSNMPIQWQGCYGGTEIDIATDMVKTDNGYMVIGRSNSENGDISYSHGGYDIWIINIDSIGNLIWERAYGGSTSDYGNRIVKDENGYYYFVAEVGSNDGDIQSGNHGGFDVWVVKINGTGDIIWEKCYGGSFRESPTSIMLLSNGNIMVTSSSTSFDGDLPANYGGDDAWIFIISPDGELLQSKVFGNDLHNNVLAAIETQDGGFFFTCKASSTNGMVEGTYHGGMTDVWALKLDSNLKIEWQMLYGGNGADSGSRGMVELPDGYMFLATTNSNDGEVSGFHGGFRDIWAVRIDLEGNIIWQRCLGGSDSDSPGDLQQTEDGGFVFFGNTSSNNGDVSGNHSYPNGWTDIWMVKLSNNGELEWQQCYGGLADEAVYSGVIKKSDNNWIIAGSSGSLYSGDVNCDMNIMEDYWVFEIKDTTTGLHDITATTDALKVYPNPARDYVVFELPASFINNAVIPNRGAGKSVGVRNPPTYLGPAGKPQGTNGGQNSRGIPHATTKSQAQGFGMTAPDDAVVIIVNVYGQQVVKLPIRSGKTVWDTRQTKPGVYFYSVEIESEVLSGKIVVQ